MWNLPKTAFVKNGNRKAHSCSLTIELEYTFPCLNLSWQRFLSYRNHSIDFLWKSMVWFLYDRDLHHEGLKLIPYHFPLLLQCFPVICSLKVSRVFGLIQKCITQNLWILTYCNPLIRTLSRGYSILIFKSFALRNFWMSPFPDGFAKTSLKITFEKFQCSSRQRCI